MPDLSEMANVYLPALRVPTVLPAFFSVIVKLGPTVPVSLVAVGAAVAGTAIAADASAASST